MKYRAYGLTIQSDIELEELEVFAPEDEHSANRPADVVIEIGAVPDQLANPSTGDGVAYQLNAQEYRMEIEGIAKYYARDGRVIIVEPAENADASTLRLFLHSSPMAALLHQRGYLPIHAGSIATPRGAVLFAGASGAGKSTTTAAFRERGYKLLSDDISVTSLDEAGIPVVLPSYPQQKLWVDTLEYFEKSRDSYSLIRPAVEKYAVPVKEDFFGEPLRLQTIYVLVEGSSPEPTLRPVTGLNKLPAIYNHIYRQRYQKQMGRLKENTAMGIAISNHVQIVSVERKKDTANIPLFIDLIEQDFLNG